MNSAIMESRNCLKETESIGKDRIVDRYLTEIVCSGGNIPESLMPDALDVSPLAPPPKKCKLSKADRNLDNNHLYPEIQRRALSNRLLNKESTHLQIVKLA